MKAPFSLFTQKIFANKKAKKELLHNVFNQDSAKDEKWFNKLAEDLELDILAAKEVRRFKAAVAAMQGLMALTNQSTPYDSVANEAVNFADALIKKLEE